MQTVAQKSHRRFLLPLSKLIGRAKTVLAGSHSGVVMGIITIWIVTSTILISVVIAQNTVSADDVRDPPNSELLYLSSTEDDTDQIASSMGQIAFVSDRDGDQEIYLMNADGRDLVNLTDNPARDISPAWSPNGGQLAFTSNRNGAYQVYVMNADGSEVRQITNIEASGDDTVSSGGPVWSPDGQSIAFVTSINIMESLRISWINADGTGLTEVFSGSGLGGQISWSPDGEQLFFDYNLNGDFNIFVVNLDGSGLQSFDSRLYSGPVPPGVTSKPAWEFDPTRSPDGQSIAFVSDRQEGRVDIWVSDAAGIDIINLTPNQINYAFGPVWSPDSQWIAFMSAGEGLYIGHVESGELRKLTDLEYVGNNRAWSWSPDNSQIVFAYHAQGEASDIYIVNTDGSGLTKLTDDLSDDGDPVWRPNVSEPESPTPPSEVCGRWGSEVADDETDQRITATLIFSRVQPPCHGAFRLENSTDFFGFGGYSFELVAQSENAELEWIHADDFILLTPLLDREVNVWPANPSSEANVHITGSMTLQTVARDTSIFLIRTALALSPPGSSCLIPEEQIILTAIRVVDIVDTTARLALQGESYGAFQEFLQIADYFYDQSAEAFAEIGFECAADQLKEIAKKPALALKIGAQYIAWVPKVIWDYWESGISTTLSLAYLMPSAETRAIVGNDGDIYLGDTMLLDIKEDAPACFGVQTISYSPTLEYFVVVLDCFEGDNEAFLFPFDGGDKQPITGEWDYINYDHHAWSSDGRYFIYSRVNDCCASPSEIPDNAPAAGLVQYDVQSGEDKLAAFEDDNSLLFQTAGVLSGDVLNVRVEPNPESSIVGTIPHDGTNLRVIGTGTRVGNSIWVQVNYGDVIGWVNSRFISIQRQE